MTEGNLNTVLLFVSNLILGGGFFYIRELSSRVERIERLLMEKGLKDGP